MPRSPLMHRLARSWLVAQALLMQSPEVFAWSFTLQSASQRVFMYVGTATYTYNAQGRAIGVSNNATTDSMTVDLTLSLFDILTRAYLRQIFNTEPRNRAYGSEWNRSTKCPMGYSMIVGAGYQNSSSSPANASVTLSSPAQLTNLEGDGIPFSTITWESYSPDTLQKDSQWIGRGTLGTTQTLATVPRNTVSEVCFEFTYGSPNLYPAGTYQGTITFTAFTP
ncbi:hypothetical protein [Hydrogenophaga sp.]|uniref:hypothetical protein n=1 Tax=Hydrogenophaga sp. TaxID=1904254 RepID=UPI0035AF458F